MEGVSLNKLLQEDKDRSLNHNEFVAPYVNLLLRESEHSKSWDTNTLRGETNPDSSTAGTVFKKSIKLMPVKI